MSSQNQLDMINKLREDIDMISGAGGGVYFGYTTLATRQVLNIIEDLSREVATLRGEIDLLRRNLDDNT